MNRLVLTDTRTGEIIDTTPLARAVARRAKSHRRPRTHIQRYYWRQVDIESLVLVNLLGLAALALLLT